ncbi:MAG: geranylgeranylglyceryl/heptaprenylglyceryl phosphate synthase [Bacteroidota bacterium]
MSLIYQDIVSNKSKRLLAVLIDPEKESLSEIPNRILKINSSRATHIFVGGSTDSESKTEVVIKEIKKYTELPIVIFPGDVNQISNSADAILFLSLISGRNPEYLIEKQVQAVPKLLDAQLEVLATGYLLIDGGSQSAVERVSKTKPLSKNNIKRIVHTAKAGELLGMKLIYLEAGSGADSPIPIEIIRAVKTQLNIPLIIGGGIKTNEQLQTAYEGGADLVVVGTAFEKDAQFFEKQIDQEYILKK